MTEKNYSVNFKLYNPDGLQAQFTVRADDMTEHLTNLAEYMESLSTMGWTVNEPAHLDGVHKTDTIIGYMWGKFKDSKNNDTYTPCLHLYNTRQKYKAYTIYPEKLDSVPANVLATRPKLIKDCVLVPPPTADAKADRDFHPWNVTINITPKLNDDGTLWKNEKGYAQYYYAGVTGVTAATPTAEQRPVEKTPAATQPTDKAVSSELVVARKVLHALGQTYYANLVNEDGEQRRWSDVRKATIVTANQNNGTSYDSLNDLPLADVEKWIVMLEKKTRALIQSLAEMLYDEPNICISQLVSDATDGYIDSLSATSGVPLTHVLKTIAAEAEKLDN